MSNVKNFLATVTNSLAEYYTLFVIVILVPLAVSLLTNFKWGLLLSFVLQSIIGVLYIKGSSK